MATFKNVFVVAIARRGSKTPLQHDFFRTGLRNKTLKLQVLVVIQKAELVLAQASDSEIFKIVLGSETCV